MVEDGICYLKNKNSGYFPGVPNSGVSSGTTLRQEVKSTTEPTCFAQMWRITHLSGLNYVIRPVHKPNMALSASSTLLTVQNTDGMASIPESCKWQITYDQNGYVFTRGYYDMLPTGHSTALNATVAMGTSNVSGSHLWSFILTDSFDDQMLLYDKRTSSYSNNIVRYVAPGETLTLSQLGIDAAFVSEDTVQQNITWVSGNTNVATANSTTGTVTTNTLGHTTITARITIDGMVYSQEYLLYSCKTINVEPYFDGRYKNVHKTSSDTDLQAENRAKARVATVMTGLQAFYLEEFSLLINYTEPSEYTSLADDCTYTGNRCICDEMADCMDSERAPDGTPYYHTYHHTNAYNILYDVAPPTEAKTYKVVFIGIIPCTEAQCFAGGFDPEDWVLGYCDPDIRVTAVYYHEGVSSETDTAIHEFGHFFRAIDHYLSGHTEMLNNDGANPPYHNDCTYGRELLPNTLCAACRAQIKGNIGNLP